MPDAIGAAILLLPGLILDLKTRKIPVLYAVVFLAAALTINLVFRRIAVLDMLYGAAIGIIFFLISGVTKESIGYGDDLLILSLGIWSGGKMLADSLLLSFSMAGIGGIVMIMIKKKGKKSRMPFVPYLFIGTAAAYLLVYTL